MAKINIEFDGKIYTVDESTLAPLASPLERALIHQLAGTGAVIRFGGTNYNVDANKLASARNVLTDHLDNVSGTDSKVTVNGTEYGLSKTKLQSATDTMNKTLGGLIKFSKGLEYTLNDDGQSYTVSNIGSCTDEEIIIPAFYEGLPVTAIGAGAFKYERGFTSVFIPEGVTSIGSGAFCVSGLRDVSLPSSLTYVADNAFAACDDLNYRTYDGGEYLGNDKTPNLVMHKLTDSTVTTFTVPDETLSLMDSVFSGCTNLEKVVMNNNINTIPISAFSGCTNLKDITIGSNVSSIGRDAFDDCTNLTNVYYNGDIASWCNIDFSSLRNDHDNFHDYYSSPMMYAENFYLKNSVRGYDLLADTLTIPDGVKTIKQGVFYGSGWNRITNISIVSEDVEVIGEFAFNGTGYYKDETKWENGVLYIDKYVIEANRNIPNEYIIRSGTKAIADGAFMTLWSLTSITIPEGIKNIGDHTFSFCGTLTNVVLPSSLKTIGERAFSNTAITSITIPEGVTHLGHQAFGYCENLTNVSVPNSLKFMDGDVFYSDSGNLVYNEFNNGRYLGNSTNPYLVLDRVDTSVTEFSILDATKILSGSFMHCSNLTSIVIPEGVVQISGATFHNCINLMSVTIPSSIEYIDSYPLEYTAKLVEVINHSRFDVVKNISPLEVHEGNSKLVKQGDYYFYTVDGINYLVNYMGIETNITLPENYNGETYVIHKAFYGNESVTSITIPDSVMNISDDTFTGCSSLTNVVLGKGITGIDGSMFSECSNLTSITIPDSITSIGSYAFFQCSNLTSITIPNSMTNVDNTAFYLCNSLTDVYIDQYEDESLLKPLEWTINVENKYDWDTGEWIETITYLYEQAMIRWKERV